MSNSCLHPREVTGGYTGVVINMLPNLWPIGMRAAVVIDVPVVVMIGVGVDMLANAEIIVVTAAVIGFEFTFEVAYAVEVLAGVRAGAIIAGAPDTAAEVDESGLAAMMAALEFEFTLPAPLEKSLL